jgi:hypothetical protein
MKAGVSFDGPGAAAHQGPPLVEERDKVRTPSTSHLHL